MMTPPAGSRFATLSPNVSEVDDRLSNSPLRVVAYRPAQVAKMINASKTTVCLLLRTGELRGVKRGGCWFVTPEAIEEFLGAQGSSEGLS